jgi:hypothetical protein
VFLLAPWLWASGFAPQPHLLTTGEMTKVRLQRLTVRLGQPIEVTQTTGRAWFPTLAKFPSGELMVTYSLVADTNENPTYLRAFQVSRDGGRSWGHRNDLIPDHQPWIYVPRDDGSLLAIPSHFYQADPEDRHNLHSTYSRFEQGGDRVVMEPAGTQVVDWPWPVGTFPSQMPRTNWIARLKFCGDALQMGDRLLATGYMRTGGNLEPRKEEKVISLLFVSEDKGRTWRYFSTVADPFVMTADARRRDPEDSRYQGRPWPQELLEASETSMIQLADGDLMAVFRVGHFLDLGRAYSGDGGRSWTQVEPIPPYSVEPSMVRTQNDTIVLSSGRPGLRVWFSTDARAETWQDIDILEHHNRWAPDASYRISQQGQRGGRGQTTSYTEIVEISANRLLLVYDRAPFGWDPTPVDSGERSRIFVLPIEVQRD